MSPRYSTVKKVHDLRKMNLIRGQQKNEIYLEGLSTLPATTQSLEREEESSVLIHK